MSAATRTAKAMYHGGILELKESLALKEGEEVTVVAEVSPSLPETEKMESLRSAAGGWKDIVDEDIEDYLYALRRLRSRPEVESWQ